MRLKKNNLEWPPRDGKQFIRSDAFGEMLISLVCQLALRYPRMDFTDAVAQVFAWFDRKLSRNRCFINKRRFPSVNAFIAYLNQSLFNAARLTERERRIHEHIGLIAVERQIVPQKATPEELAILDEMVETLTEPHKTVFHRLFFDEEDLSIIASILNMTEAMIVRLYEEAIDMLYERISSGPNQF